MSAWLDLHCKHYSLRTEEAYIAVITIHCANRPQLDGKSSPISKDSLPHHFNPVHMSAGGPLIAKFLDPASANMRQRQRQKSFLQQLQMGIKQGRQQGIGI